MELDQLMQQAKKIQEEMQKSHDQLVETKVVGEAGAGLVKVKMNGRHDVETVSIDPSLMGENVVVLQDLLASAFNDAVQRVEKLNRDSLSKLTDGLELPADFDLKL